MEVYFELPGVGELMLEHSFYMLDGEPILFVCKDAKGTRFLCSCYQMDKNWVIGQVAEGILLDLIDDKITIREVFERHCGPKWIAAWDGEDFSFESSVPDDVLPRKGALLELVREKTGQYRETLIQKPPVSPHKTAEDYLKMIAERPGVGWMTEMNVPMTPGAVLREFIPHISRQELTEKEPAISRASLSDSFPVAA